MSDGLQKFFDSLSTHVCLGYAHSEYPEGVEPLGETPDKVVVVLGFSEKGFGFGEVSFVQTKEGLFLDTEDMGPEKVKKYLSLLVDQAILDTDEDPEKHLLYNKVRNSVCSEHCKICHPEEQKGP